MSEMLNRNFSIFKGEVIKEFNETKRYKLSFLSDIIVYYLVFLLMYFIIKGSMQGMTDLEKSLSISTTIISYISWFYFSFTLSFICNTISSETSSGTLEQLFIGPNGVEKVLNCKMAVIILKNLIMIVPLALMIFLTTGCKLIISGYTIIIFLMMIFGVFGLSLILGGLQIYYKNLGQIPFLISILFLGSSYINTSSLPESINKLLYILPFQKGCELIKYSVSSVSIIKSNDIILLAINSLMYFLIGKFIWKKMIKKAKKDGRVGSY